MVCGILPAHEKMLKFVYKNISAESKIFRSLRLISIKKILVLKKLILGANS